MAQTKKAAPKKAVKKAASNAAPKKALKKVAPKKAAKALKKPAVKKSVEPADQQISGKQVDQAVVNLVRARNIEARQVAIEILQQLGSGFITIHEMIKASKQGRLVIYKNSAHKNLANKLSWNDAKVTILNIFKFGLVEMHPEIKDCFKIHLDKEYRINYFENWKLQLLTKISDANISIGMVKEEEEYVPPVPGMQVVK